MPDKAQIADIAELEAAERDEKDRRVRTLLAERGLDALLLRHPSNVAWLSGGGRIYINTVVESGVGSLLVTPGARYLLTDVIEARRLAEEEGFEGNGWQVIAEPWHRAPTRLAELTRGMRVGADRPGDQMEDLGTEVAQLRWHLTPAEVARYRALGKEMGAALGEAARRVRPGMTEHQIAGLIAQAAYDYGALPIVELVATDERVAIRRHPLPTGRQLERTAMLVLCARRHGLVVSLTRLVSFGPVTDDRQRRMRAVATIEATALEATRPGVKASDIFAATQQAYADTGFPGEWANHHQGGAAGYESRDYVATPDTPFKVEPVQAFAWNPSVPGAKSEDTFVVTGSGAELLTPTPGWPYQQVKVGATVMERPDILQMG